MAAAQDAVVLHEHRARVQARADELVAAELALPHIGKLAVLLAQYRGEVARRQRLTLKLLLLLAAQMRLGWPAFALKRREAERGVDDKPPLDLALDALPKSAVVYDIVYVPLETQLLAAARGRGNLAIDGLGMLLHQARVGFRDWFGHTPVVNQALRSYVLEAL